MQGGDQNNNITIANIEGALGDLDDYDDEGEEGEDIGDDQNIVLDINIEH